MNCQKNMIIKKGFNSEPVHNVKYPKTKIKTYEGKISKNVHDDDVPKVGSHCIQLSVILLDSVFKIGKNYYFQAFLEECKYTFEENC